MSTNISMNGEPEGVDAQLRRLLEPDTAAARQSLYLRLHYSRAWARALNEALAAGTLEPAVARAFAEVDFDRLEHERRARVRNLAQALGSRVEMLRGLQGDQWHALVEAFCESAQFWEIVGRSHTESFCLFAWEQLRTTDPWLSEVARLEGVLVGLSVSPGLQSPWSELGLQHEIKTESEGRHETYVADYAVIDEHGQLPSRSNMEGLRSLGPGRYPVSVELGPEGLDVEIDLAWSANEGR